MCTVWERDREIHTGERETDKQMGDRERGKEWRGLVV